MRDPNLTESRSTADLRVKPPHGRQTRVALGLEANGDGSRSNAGSHFQPENGQFRINYGRGADGGPDSGPRLNGLTPSAGPEIMLQPSEQPASGRPHQVQRARSDFGPRHRGQRHAVAVEEDLWRMRHGWEDEYTSNEYLALLNSVSHRPQRYCPRICPKTMPYHCLG